MRVIIVLIAFLFFYLFIGVMSSFAVAPTITAYPSGTINIDTSFAITATMSGLSKSATYRLRIAIAQPLTSNYFGSTYNGTSWYNGTPSPINYANFLTISTDAIGVWGGDIQGKIDSDDPNFTTGSGTYDLKIGRYTQTGSSATWSEPVSIVVAVPPTPTPTNTPTPTPTSSLTPTPTKTPTPTPIPNTPTSKPSVFPTSKVLPTDVLGESTQSGSIVSPTDVINKKNVLISNKTKNPNNNFQKILLFVGIVFVAACAILTIREIRKRKLMKNE